MTVLSNARIMAEHDATQKPPYERPTLKVMEQDEVLQAFQMTATEISAAGCWWVTC
jgi:hypothetical protein